MAKVNNTDIYKYDEMPTLLDFLLGSDVGNNRVTRSYKLKSIIDLVNGTNGVNGIQYYFSDGSDVDIDYNSKGYFFTDTNEASPSNFTKLIFNKKTETGLDLSALFNFFGITNDLVLKIANPSNPNNFLHFTVNNCIEDVDFVTFDVDDNVNLGSLTNGFVYSIYWDIASSGGGGGVATKYTFSFPVILPSGDTFGRYINGELASFTAKTVPEIVQQIGQKVLNPQLIPPTFTISLPNYTQREVGSTYSELMTANFNRGQIKGKLVAGVWQENTKQNDRAGEVSDYILDGTTQAGNTKTVSKVLEIGNNVFNGSVNYLTGPQPTNSASENFDTPYPPGTMSDSKIIPADYPVFYGTLLPTQTIGDINLSTFTKITNINANNTVIIPYSSVVDKKLVILIPFEKTVKTKWYVDELNSANIGGFGDLFPTPASENYVSPTGLWTSKSFRVYISTPTTLNLPIQLRN